MKQEKGILLIEVLIALLILDVSVLSLLKYQWQSQKQLHDFRRRFMATVYIDNATERLLAGDKSVTNYLDKALTPVIPTVLVTSDEYADSSVIEVSWKSINTAENVSRKRIIYRVPKS